jgi:UDP-N-acetylmuramoyl-tripeptide--D-alanyl-D-alanine ligase
MAVSMFESTLELQDVVAATGGALRVGSPGALRFPRVSIDSRTVGAGELFFAIKGPRFDGHDFLAAAAARGARAAVVHREAAAPAGFPLLQVADTTEALAALGSHRRRQAAIPVVAVTGSAGKTTTKEMTAALLARRGPVLKTEGNLNNQYGLPLTLLRLMPEHRHAVLELGMSAAGELRALSALARPDVAVITMVAPVHLEFFDSVDAIADAKAEILEGLGPDGLAVLNGDDARVRRVGEAFRARGGKVAWFGRDRAYAASAENWRGTVHGMRFDLRLGGQALDVALPLPGPHFLSNFLAAAAAAHHLGVLPAEIAEAALEMKAASHRGQVLRLGQGVTVLDDCYNSNPAAVEAAVAALDMAARGRRLAILGDMLELGPRGEELHRETGRLVAKKLDRLAGVGPLGAHFLEGAREAGLRPEALTAWADSAAAAAAVSTFVRPGDAVLVKGSRGMRMEQVVDALTATFGRAEG